MRERRRIIRQSHNRCRKQGLRVSLTQLPDVLRPAELEARQRAQSNLINAAVPYLTLMAETFRSCASLLALADKDAYLVCLKGPAHMLKARRSFGLIEGACLNERIAGTNAIALCLQTGQPFFMTGDDYYLDIFKNGACYAAPIINDGELIGAVIIVHPRQMGHPHTFALVQTLAQLIAREYEDFTHGTALVSLCDSINTAVVHAQVDGIVKYANLRARRLLHVNKGVNISRHFNVPLFTMDKVHNEIVYSRHARMSFLVSRKKLSGHFLFLFEPLEDELQKEKKIRTTLAPYCFDDIIGLHTLKQKALHLALQDVNVLVVGESGTGKELFASAIHNASARAGARFVVMNCAAIPETLVESELFGYRRGAFTDARYDRTGRVEYASCGTLFLDEIGELPLTIQSKLLRVIEDKFVTPLGSNEQKDVDVRFIFATNKNMEDLVHKKKFRQDLYYRITTPCIKIPPLRHRKKEIPLLIEWYLQRVQEDHQRFVTAMSQSALEKLLSYEYPGNVRELQGIIKSAFLTCRGEKIEEEDIELPEDGRAIGLREKLDKLTMHIIHDQMLLHKNNVHSVARTLKVSPRTIYRYLKKY